MDFLKTLVFLSDHRESKNLRIHSAAMYKAVRRSFDALRLLRMTGGRQFVFVGEFKKLLVVVCRGRSQENIRGGRVFSCNLPPKGQVVRSRIRTLQRVQRQDQPGYQPGLRMQQNSS